MPTVSFLTSVWIKIILQFDTSYYSAAYFLCWFNFILSGADWVSFELCTIWLGMLTVEPFMGNTSDIVFLKQSRGLLG
jgi:hypothetical protein